MVRIVIDARMIGAVPHGIARYVKNLAAGLAELPSLKYEPIFLVSHAGRSQIPEKFRTETVQADFLSAKELLELPRTLKELAPALYHSPSFSSLISCPCPWIVTIHDLNHLHFGGFKEKIYYKTLLKNFARGARRVMTVSEFSQREIAKWLGVPPAQIEIVYNAIEPVFCEPTEQSLPPTLIKNHLRAGNFLLYISHHSKAHKNSEMLLRSYIAARRKSPELPPLVLNASREDLPEALRGLPGIIPVGKIPDGDLRALLEFSRAALFPSLYEGFGLTPLEAAMLGARLLVSDIPSHREALVDFSPPQLNWLKPGDQESWTQGLIRLKNAPVILPPDPDQLARAEARFSVSGLAEHMDQIYRSVLSLGT